MNQVKFPEMRHELIYDMRALLASGTESPADWRRVVHTLEAAIHIVYDDSALSQDASSEVGWMLKSEEEAESIRAIVAAMENVFAKFGVKPSDDGFLGDPRWVALMSAVSHFVFHHGEPASGD